uniref:Uncharacterized protein n=1 Tax=Cucumis melo TaxID=3656 RepID=A0A9I9E9M1_CUCME
MSWKSMRAELKYKIFTTIEAAFVIHPRSRKNILQTACISFHQFKNWLTTKYIMPHKDEPQLLQFYHSKSSHTSKWRNSALYVYEFCTFMVHMVVFESY